ncbi:hypothetical protein [Trueperella pyogenes]
MAEVINALGGLAGLAALLTAFAGFRNVKRDTAKIAAAPDSLADKIDSLAERVEYLAKSSVTTHELLARRLDGHDREFREMKKRQRARRQG